ncbi:MAG: poly-gamma-glutamate system protein [Candidatus Eisenbacteria bacterium]
MSGTKVPASTLVGLALFALVAYAVAERSVEPVHAKAYQMKLRAVALAQSAGRAIAATKKERGIVSDPGNDPEGSGLIGPQFSLITTDRGVQAAKALAAHPNFAAAVTQMMLEAGVRSGDLVAVGMTGSLPGLNVAVLAACRSIGAEPVIVTSAGSSMFGATDPELTWLDMEQVCVKRGLWNYRSLAASLGGGGDAGRGLSPQGRQLLLDAMRRSGTAYLGAPNLFEAVKARVALYDSVAAARGKPIRLYVNVGGGVASLGGAQNARLIPAGLTRRLAAKNYPNRGVLNVLAERRVPIVQLLEVESLARTYSIVDTRTGATPRPGKGLLFIKYRYNLWIVAAAAAAVLLLNVFVLRLDIRHQMLGRPHPERRPSA